MFFQEFLQAAWFFLPALVANQCPGISRGLDLPGNFPVSVRWLGAHKTWAAYYVAVLGGVLTLYIQRLCTGVNESLALFDYNRSDLWLIGVLFGLGTVGGDHAKAFIKRRLGIKAGAPWWPFDQLDFVFGAALLVSLVLPWVGWNYVVYFSLLMLFVHPIGNGIGYRLGFREVPW